MWGNMGAWLEWDSCSGLALLLHIQPPSAAAASCAGWQCGRLAGEESLRNHWVEAYSRSLLAEPRHAGQVLPSSMYSIDAGANHSLPILYSFVPIWSFATAQPGSMCLQQEHQPIFC